MWLEVVGSCKKDNCVLCTKSDDSMQQYMRVLALHTLKLRVRRYRVYSTEHVQHTTQAT